MGGHAQIWKGFIWFAQGCGTKSHSKENQPDYTRNMEWISLEVCSHPIILRENDWFGTDWWHPGIYWVASNGTPWLYAPNLRPLLPPTWLGCCTLSWPWAQERIFPTVTTSLEGHMDMFFYWYDHLADVFFPSIGLKDVIVHNRSP